MNTITLKGYLLSIFFILTACSSDEVPEGPSSPDELQGEEVFPAYDKSLIEESAGLANNLINNGDFNDDGAWVTCGDAEIVTINEEKVMQLGTGHHCEGASRNINASIVQEIALHELPEELNISFRIRAEGEIPGLAFQVYLGNTQDEFQHHFGGQYIGGATQSADESDDAWNRINFLLKRNQIETWLDAPTPLFLSFSVENFDKDSPTKMYLDDIMVSQEAIKYTQTSPMPDALLNYTGNSRILFYDLSDSEQRVASMMPNGDDRIIHSWIDATTVAGLPRWSGSNEILLSQKTFYPLQPDDASIVPAGETRVIRYNLNNKSEEEIFKTKGEPGVYLFEGALENLAALDVEVRRTAWDEERDRGILCVCGRNRSPQLELNSDDICWIYLFDAVSNEVINDKVKGFAPKWSSSGKLAYYYDDQLLVAEVNGSEIYSTSVHTNPSLLQCLDWSPDENYLVFAEAISGNTIINGEEVPIYTIKTLNVTTGEEKVLLQVDHGQLLANLSWSPDGAYILYSLNTEEGAQIWWLEVATGLTGPITNTINAYAASWR